MFLRLCIVYMNMHACTRLQLYERRRQAALWKKNHGGIYDGRKRWSSLSDINFCRRGGQKVSRIYGLNISARCFHGEAGQKTREEAWCVVG